MVLIEIPLNSYRYHFRRLTWEEEAQLPFVKGEDQRKILLSRVLVDVSGLTITAEDALVIFKQLPDALFWRIWLVYRGNLPEERYFSAGGLYEAPDQVAYHKKLMEEEAATEEVVDAVTARIEHQFGKSGVAEAESISRQMFQKAQKAGTLIPARGE